QIWEQALMLAQPLQRGVREDERARLWRRPVRDVGLDPLDGRWLGRGLGQHFARTVDGAQGPVGPAAGDGAGMDTGAAAELVERAGRQLADARQELEAGPEPLVAELEVKRWVPRHDHLVRCRRRRHAGQNWLRFVIFRFAAGLLQSHLILRSVVHVYCVHMARQRLRVKRNPLSQSALYKLRVYNSRN